MATSASALATVSATLAHAPVAPWLGGLTALALPVVTNLLISGWIIVLAVNAWIRHSDSKRDKIARKILLANSVLNLRIELQDMLEVDSWQHGALVRGGLHTLELRPMVFAAHDLGFDTETAMRLMSLVKAAEAVESLLEAQREIALHETTTGGVADELMQALEESFRRDVSSALALAKDCESRISGVPRQIRYPLFECPDCGTTQIAGNDTQPGDLVTCKVCGFTGELSGLDEGDTPMDDRLFECPECGTAQDAGNDAHEGDLVTCKACGFTGELFKLDEGHTPTDADE